MQNASKQIALGHRLCRSQLGDMNVPAFLILRLCTLGTTLEHDLGALQGAELAALAGSTAQTPLEVFVGMPCAAGTMAEVQSRSRRRISTNLLRTTAIE